MRDVHTAIARNSEHKMFGKNKAISKTFRYRDKHVTITPQRFRAGRTVIDTAKIEKVRVLEIRNPTYMYSAGLRTGVWGICCLLLAYASLPTPVLFAVWGAGIWWNFSRIRPYVVIAETKEGAHILLRSRWRGYVRKIVRILCEQLGTAMPPLEIHKSDWPEQQENLTHPTRQRFAHAPSRSELSSARDALSSTDNMVLYRDALVTITSRKFQSARALIDLAGVREVRVQQSQDGASKRKTRVRGLLWQIGYIVSSGLALFFTPIPEVLLPVLFAISMAGLVWIFSRQWTYSVAADTAEGECVLVRTHNRRYAQKIARILGKRTGADILPTEMLIWDW